MENGLLFFRHRYAVVDLVDVDVFYRMSLTIGYREAYIKRVSANILLEPNAMERDGNGFSLDVHNIVMKAGP